MRQKTHHLQTEKMGGDRIQVSFMPIRKEVKLFIAASERMYQLLSEGQSLNAHEAETVRCCLHELVAEGILTSCGTDDSSQPKPSH